MKRYQELPYFYGIYMNEDGREYTRDSKGNRVLYTPEIEMEHIAKQYSHHFNSFVSSLVHGEFDSEVMHIEHIPSYEVVYAMPTYSRSYPIKGQRKNGGYLYKGLEDEDDMINLRFRCFVLLPSRPMMRKNIARLEFAIHSFIDYLERKCDMHHDPEFEEYDPMFYVYVNGVLRIDWKFFMTKAEFAAFEEDKCCHISWPVIDYLQALCEKYGYYLK